uniref:Uncharacterized protein n=1 Tax=viral metagenome TaxID=1070528 RepID=A0A6H1ZZM7_9ZZZZ
MIHNVKKLYRYQVEREQRPTRQEIEAVIPGVEVGLTYDGHGLKEVVAERELTSQELGKLRAMVGQINLRGES